MCKKLPSSKGFTLVEVLVAMLIAGVLMLAVMRLFTRIGETFDINATSMELTETTRVALRFVKNDLIQAGYLGCVQTYDLDNKGYGTRVGSAISGVEYQDEGGGNGIWSEDPIDIDGVDFDVLNLFYVQDLDVRVLAVPSNSDSGRNGMLVEAHRLFDGGDPIVSPGDWLAVYNCRRATPFILTNTPQAFSAVGSRFYSPGLFKNDLVTYLDFDIGIDFKGHRNTETSFFTNGDTPYNFDGRDGGGAMIGQFFQVEYRVAPSVIDGGETNSLFRLVNDEDPDNTNEIVRLVKAFNVEYGIDENQDGLMDRYVDDLSDNADIPVMARVVIEVEIDGRTQELTNIVKIRNKGL